MRRVLVLLALLVLPSLLVAAPSGVAEPQCVFYSTQTVQLWGARYLRTQEYRCSESSGGSRFEQHVRVVRVAEEAGDPSKEWDDRVVAHVEYQAVTRRDPSGVEERQTFVVVRDTSGPVGYQRAEYSDARSPSSACEGRVSYYRASDYRMVSLSMPVCVPMHDVLP